MSRQKYFGGLLQDYQNGCRMDLRLKLAVQFLNAGIIDAQQNSKERANEALDLAEALISEAEMRDWLKGLPLDSELPQDLLLAIHREAACDVERSQAQQAYAREIADRIQRPGVLR